MAKKTPDRLCDLRARAEAGDAHAQYALGCVYYEADGAARNYREALKWYRKAAAQGHNSGLCDVAFCYRNGHGVRRNYAKAIPLYRQAADQGCPTGAFWLGVAYEKGQGVARDLAQARHWYEISRARGDADAAEALRRLAP
jgi:TPR repeat protein